MNQKTASERAIKLLGPMGAARVHKKSPPGARYQVGLLDTEGVLRPVDTVGELRKLLQKPGPTFKKMAEGRTFEEALATVQMITDNVKESTPC